jgi:two-component system CheB/CheR fusion protein
LNADLESKVAARTADLEAANEAKSRFLSAASHDLRQPLQVLSLLEASLAVKVHDPTARKIVSDMAQGLRVTVGILDSLVEVSQLERGGIKPQLGDFALADLFDSLARELGPALRDKGLELRVVRPRAVVRSDRALLERILRNLLSNAVKYTRTGKVLIGCRHRGADVRIEVWDTGAGIGPEHLGRIFEEFYQVGNPVREAGNGQGLGLTIVARMARLLGHLVSVRSTLGKGSVFTVEVPLGNSALAPTPHGTEIGAQACTGGS